LLVLHAGLPWEWLPQELGYGSGMTCRRRLRDWQAAGVWSRLHRSLLEELHAAGQIDWDRSAVDAGPGTQGTPVQGTVLSFTTPAAPVTPPPATGPTITTTALPAATVGKPYSATLTASGGTGPATWSIIQGRLPSGLTLHAATGTITGTPQVPWPPAASITVEVRDDTIKGHPGATLTLTLPVNRH
jgi:hypothetical protein